MRVADVIPPIQIISLNYIDALHDTEAAFRSLLRAIEGCRLGRMPPRRDWPSPEGNRAAWWAEPAELDFREELTRHGCRFVGRQWFSSGFANGCGGPSLACCS